MAEKIKLDIEYRLEELKMDMQKYKSREELTTRKPEDLEKLVMAA